MASLILDADGSRRVSFTGLGGKRQTIRIAKGTNAKACERFKAYLERLLEARTMGEPLDRPTAEWVAGLCDTMHERLARTGLVQAREAAEVVTLHSMLEAYFAVCDNKASTIVRIRQVASMLVQHFGAERDVETITERDADVWRSTLKAEGYAGWIWFRRGLNSECFKPDRQSNAPGRWANNLGPEKGRARRLPLVIRPHSLQFHWSFRQKEKNPSIAAIASSS